jgi:histidyl-tRNA synthetase
VALIVGEDELRAGEVSLKPLRRNEAQQRVARERVAEALKNMLCKDGT